MSPERERLVVVGAAAAAYFIAFPEDLAPVRDVIALTNAVSPWLYAALLGSVACWAAVRLFGPRIAPK
jgi:hypothetical protein